MVQLLEPLADIARLNELEEQGFSDIEAIREVLAIRRETFVSSVDRLLSVVRYWDARIEQVKALRTAASDEIARCQRRRGNTEEFIKYCMGEFPGEPFVGRTGRFVERKNGGKAPLTVPVDLNKVALSNVLAFEDIEKIPQKYLKRVEHFTIDLDAVRADLELGVDVPGFKLGERGTHIRDSL